MEFLISVENLRICEYRSMKIFNSGFSFGSEGEAEKINARQNRF